MIENRINQIKDFSINNINDITQFILFLIKGEKYPPNQLEDTVFSLYTENLDVGISNFIHNIKHFYPFIQEKLKESFFLTERIYKIFLKFPIRFANGVNKERFYFVMRYLVKLSSYLQEYAYNKDHENLIGVITNNDLFEEMKKYERKEEYEQDLTEIIINLLLNSTKLNSIKND